MGKLLVIRDCSVRSVPAHLKHNKPSIERPTYYACSWQVQKIFAAVSPDYSKNAARKCYVISGYDAREPAQETHQTGQKNAISGVPTASTTSESGSPSRQ
jgi:hypothetical protein